MVFLRITLSNWALIFSRSISFEYSFSVWSLSPEESSLCRRVLVATMVCSLRFVRPCSSSLPTLSESEVDFSGSVIRSTGASPLGPPLARLGTTSGVIGGSGENRG